MTHIKLKVRQHWHWGSAEIGTSESTIRYPRDRLSHSPPTSIASAFLHIKARLDPHFQSRSLAHHTP
jgi:hypothetical protein